MRAHLWQVDAPLCLVCVRVRQRLMGAVGERVLSSSMRVRALHWTDVLGLLTRHP